MTRKTLRWTAAAAALPGNITSITARSNRAGRELATALALALLAPIASVAQEAQEAIGAARGVNPADNITKFELLPKLTVTDDSGGISATTFTLKYDRAIQGRYGLNFELPLTRFESPFGSDNGIGDLNVRGRFQGRVGKIPYILGAEAVLPVATADSLGTGKYQVNPTMAAVYPFSEKVFAAVVAKHLFSVAGEDDRDDITQGQYRMLFAYTSPRGWWMLGDPQYWVDYENDGRNELAIEIEAGRMIGPLTGVWLRAGGHAGGNWDRQDWTVSGGIRWFPPAVIRQP